jgi:hypothetical protein
MLAQRINMLLCNIAGLKCDRIAPVLFVVL